MEAIIAGVAISATIIQFAIFGFFLAELEKESR